MIVYFGKDTQGYYADAQDGSRQYLSETLWHQYVAAGAHAGVDVSQVQVKPVKLRIVETMRLDKFEGDQLIETVHRTDPTSI